MTRSTPTLALPESPLILIADDDPVVRRMLHYALEREGYRIEQAENGPQALEAFDHHAPDMVLLDAVMPELDGFQVCARMRTASRGRGLPILMITSLDDDESVRRAFEAGASDYITKPIHWAVLRQRARRILEAGQTERRVQHLAYHDTLTGLPNRVLLGDRLGQAITAARRTPHPLAVLFMDLDRFKWVNDTLGHDAGDRLLQEMAGRLIGQVRESDTVARLGGDEFVLLLDPIQQPEDAALVARKLLEVLRQPFILDDQTLPVTASIGIATYPADGEDIGTLLKHADTAMYHAKEQGRNQYAFYGAEMTRRVSRRLELQNGLRQALENGELSLHYQPQVDLESGQIGGTEALLRWHHPLLGNIPPTDFIPLAEETGLILPIGDWVLHQACAQTRAWREEGLPPIGVSVNLSARQFRQPDLATRVARILSETRLDSPGLEVEITESLLMQDVEAAIDILHALRSLGVGIAIDDFGTGYSSLNYLRRFPIDRLKIDRSFVGDITRSPDDAAIARAVIALAASLRLGTVAEGVEEEAQLGFLRRQGCQSFQGYYFSRPLPAEGMTALLREGRCLPVPVALQERTLLLVDDEPHVTAALSRSLRGAGYRVLTAGTTRQGFELLALHPVGVVVSDQLMPETSGTEFLAKVRELHPRTVRVILSGQSARQDLIDAINQGAVFRFLDKPVDDQRLRAVIREAFLLFEARNQAGEDGA